MTRCLTPIFIFIFANTFLYGQDFKIVFIKERPDCNKYDTKNSTISYPLFTFKSALVSKRINKVIKKDFEEIYETKTGGHLRAMLKEATKQGLTAMEYNFIRNNNTFFSFYLSFEGTRAYTSYWENYYCFNKKTGHLLTLDSLISPDKKYSFLQMIKRKQKENIEKYKKDMLFYLGNGNLQKDDYSFANQQIKNNCWDSYSPKKFKVLKDKIEVIIDCAFPHAIMAINPPTKISFSIAAFKQYLKKNYKDL